jgi:hypothetical protein
MTCNKVKAPQIRLRTFPGVSNNTTRTIRAAELQTDNSPNLLAHSNVQQSSSGQRNMEFEALPQQQFAMGQYSGGATMDMRSLAGALPDYAARQFQQQHFQQQYPSQGGANQNLMYQYQQSNQFAGQTGNNYNPNLAQQYHAQYMHQISARPHPPGFAGYPTTQAPSHSYQNQTMQIQQDFTHGQPQQFLQIPPGQYVSQYGNRGAPGYQQPQMRSSGNTSGATGLPMYQHMTPQCKFSGLYPVGIAKLTKSSCATDEL